MSVEVAIGVDVEVEVAVAVVGKSLGRIENGQDHAIGPEARIKKIAQNQKIRYQSIRVRMALSPKLKTKMKNKKNEKLYNSHRRLRAYETSVRFLCCGIQTLIGHMARGLKTLII